MIPAVLEQDADLWLEDAVATIRAIANTHEFFSADDLRGEMRPPAHPNWTGKALVRAKSLGHIESAGYQTSHAKSRKHGVTRTWRRRTEGAS